MKNNIYKLKREAIPILLFYIFTDIFVIGAYYVSSLGLNHITNIFSKIFKTFENFMPNLTNPLATIGKIFSSPEIIGGFLSISFYYFLVILVLYIFYKVKNEKTYEYEGIENGSSEWAVGGEEFHRLHDGSEILNKKEGFILSKNHYLGTDQKKVKINKNILVIGGSGSGKSACFVKPNILQRLGSYVVTDPKGELYRETSGYLKSNGYKVQVLNLIETEYSNRYNPLSHIRDHNDVNIIAETIIKGGEGGGKSADPFWDNTATMLLKACIYYVISVLPAEERNLSSCVNIIRAGGNDEEILNKLFINELKPEHPGRKEYESIRLAADKTKQSIAITVASKLKDFDSPSIQKVTTSNEFDFSMLAKQKMIIYVITPPDHSTYDYLMTVFFSQLFQILFSDAYKLGGSLKNPVYFLLDEFPNIGQLPSFEKKLSTTRSYGISVSIIVQALDQLEALYKDQYETIIGNCDTQIFLGSQSLKTCEYVSKSLGQKTIKFKSKSVNKDKDEMTKQSVSISEQRQARELMTVDEIKRMDPNEEILLIRGLKPIKAKKAWYFRYHPEREKAKEYILHDISETPKPVAREICTFDVQEHLKNRFSDAFNNSTNSSTTTSSSGGIGGQVKENVNIEIETESAELIPSKEPQEQEKVYDPANEYMDLKMELEKKFDELFGS